MTKEEQIQELLAICAVKDEALNNSLPSLICTFTEKQHLPACDSFENPYERWCSVCKRRKMIKDALTNYSQAAKEMVEKLNQYEHNKDCAICANERADELSEQNERMRKALEKFKLELTPHSFCSRIEYEQVHHALDEALTPPTGQKEKE